MEVLKGKDIKNILSHNKNLLKTKTFIVIYQKNNLGYPRFGFIASKKLSKKAVERNRAKRLLKEAVRLNFPSIKDLSYDIVFIARKYILNSKLQDVLEDLLSFLKYLRENNEKNVNLPDKTL